MTELRVGVDVGTSAAKAAAFAADGAVRSRGRSSLPPVERAGSAAWQPLEGVLRSAAEAVRELRLDRAEATVSMLALTAQRDTAVLLDREGEPLSPLISWQDARAVEAGSLWDALAAEEDSPLERLASVRALPSLLAERWTGRALETHASLSVHLREHARSRLKKRAGPDLDLPEVRPLGRASAPVRSARDGLPAELDGVPLEVTAGDKNCEMLGNGVREPGQAYLSLGSAVSMGTLEAAGDDEPGDEPVFRSPAALRGRRNVEVGLVAGLDGGRYLAGLLGRDARPEPDGRLRTDVWCVPYFRGALDAPGARALLAGLDRDRGADAVTQAWAQGVVGELRRLRPALERAAGSPLETLAVGGGGARSPGWARLLADALELPVRRAPDAWSGARGAVGAALRARESASEEEFTRTGERTGRPPITPDPDAAQRAARYYDRYEELARAARELAEGGS